MKTLLLAESHAPTLDHLQAALTQAGYQVQAVAEPGRAMEQFVAGRPDAVVVAVDFPRLDGQHLGQLIRSTDHGARVPVVAIDKGHLGRAKGVAGILDLKVNAYIADPLKVAELTAKLTTLLAAAAQAAAQAEPDGPSGVEAVLSRPPVATGELRGFPLPALLHGLFRTRRDGVLVVVQKELTRRVFFVQGNPVAFDSSARQDSFPVYLAERGTLTEPQATATLQALQGGLRIGAALGEAGVDLEGEVLRGALAGYTADRLAAVVGMREGRYVFYAGDEFANQVARVAVAALPSILDGARRSFPIKVYAQALKPHLGEYPQLAPSFGQELEELGLGSQRTAELKMAIQIDGKTTLRDLLIHGRGDFRERCSLFWYLQLVEAVAFSRTPSAGSSHEHLAPAEQRLAVRKRKPLPPATVTELRDAAVKIITGSYFRVLGLDIAADTDAVERAYQEVATRFHPDSYAEFDTSELQDLLDAVQDKLSASYRVLSVEEKRKAYLQHLFSRLDVPGRVGPIHVDAEIALRRGVSALRRKDARTALIAFEEATTLNPREPEFFSHLGWATYLATSGDKKDRAKAAQKHLKRALALNPALERAQIISAIIESETGDHSGARKKLLKVLELNPDSGLAKAALRKVGR